MNRNSLDTSKHTKVTPVFSLFGFHNSLNFKDLSNE
jgi:hypothetical protein